MRARHRPQKKFHFHFYLNLLFLALLLFFITLFRFDHKFEKSTLVFRPPLVQALETTLPPPAVYPTKVTGLPAPRASAQSLIAIDENSMKTLYEQNAHTRLFPASTTKLLTALVALEYFDANAILITSRENVEGSALGLKRGERMTFMDLLKATLISSSNDTALVIADNYPGGEVEFVKKMNAKAQKLNLSESHFVNPTGLHHQDHYSTARDLARLGAVANKSQTIKRIVTTKQTSILNLTTGVNLQIENLNQLLGTNGVDGIKTGFTEEAGGCLIASKTIGGTKVITVVLKSEDRFLDTDRLLSYVFSSYRW
jgi:D-alanyl-D-alanine carboxypeptidase (penicillin-binding protein 5/6)